jgi:hypothetical protein
VKKDRKVIVIILFVLLTIVLVIYFSFNNTEEKKRYRWTEGYKVKSNQPYGTQFVQKLLKSSREGQPFTVNEKKSLPNLLDTLNISVKTDYIFIGQNIYLNEEDRTALLNFISEGNDAFVSAANVPYDLIYAIYSTECNAETLSEMIDTIAVTMNFYNATLRTQKGYTYSFRNGTKDERYLWTTLNRAVFCDSTKQIVPLGQINPDKVNFARIKYGKGYLYLHTNPIVFTNYFLTKEDKTEYASNVFAHLNGQAVIWDEMSKSDYGEQQSNSETSPIAYILEQESLRYAWWLMLASAILYTLFAAKRKQRIIPVLEEKSNTSLEFLNMISALHFQNADPLNMAKKKLKYFYYFIKAKYGFHTQSLSEAQLTRLAEKSKVSLSDLQSVYHEVNIAEKNGVYNENRLVDLHRALEKFYKNCK